MSQLLPVNTSKFKWVSAFACVVFLVAAPSLSSAQQRSNCVARCPTVFAQCGVDRPRSQLTIPPEPPKTIDQTSRPGAVLGVNGTSHADRALSLSLARDKAANLANALCRRNGARLSYAMPGYESCKATRNGKEFLCEAQAIVNCVKNVPNPAHRSWTQERDRISHNYQNDKQDAARYRACVAKATSRTQRCERACKTHEQATVRGGAGGSQSRASSGNVAAPRGGSVSPRRPVGIKNRNGSAVDRGAARRRRQRIINQNRARRYNALAHTSANAIVAMGQNMDKKTKSRFGWILIGTMAAALLGVEAYGVATGDDTARAVGGGLFLAGAFGTTLWQTVSTLKKRYPAAGPYTWTGIHSRVGLSYERSWVNYTERDGDDSIVQGLRGHFSLTPAWLRIDLDGGIRFGTVKANGEKYDHLGAVLSAGILLQPVKWSLLSPYLGLRFTTQVQSNDGGKQPFPKQNNDIEGQVVIGNTFAFGRAIGGTYLSHGPDGNIKRKTLFFEPELSFGSMGTTLLLRFGSMQNSVFGTKISQYRKPRDGQFDTKLMLAVNLLFDGDGVGTGIGLGGCMNFKISEGGHFCLPVSTGLFVDGRGAGFVDAHLLGVGFGSFSKFREIVGYASLGGRLAGNAGTKNAGDVLDPLLLSMKLGLQASFGFVGAKAELLLLPDVSTRVSMGVAF